MIFRAFAALTTLAVISACDEAVVSTPTGAAPQPSVQQVPDELRGSQQAARAFASMVRRVEPVAERVCQQRTTGVNCDFKILVDDRPGVPSNAFQTLDDDGRPLIVFTIRLIQDARNEDELAFVMGHEAAHHVRGHIARQKQNAAAGAVIFGGLATLAGTDPAAAQRIGAQVGARTYSKDFELEADELGTRITAAAGYDPVKGSQFFNRIPDPGDRFLGTHPPNAQRLDIVRRTAARL